MSTVIDCIFNFGKGNSLVLTVDKPNITVSELLLAFSAVSGVTAEDILYVIIDGQLVGDNMKLSDPLMTTDDKYLVEATGNKIHIHIVTRSLERETDKFDQLFSRQLSDTFAAVEYKVNVFQWASPTTTPPPQSRVQIARTTSANPEELLRGILDFREVSLGPGPPGLQEMMTGALTEMMHNLNLDLDLDIDLTVVGTGLETYEQLSQLQPVTVGVNDDMFSRLTKRVTLSNLSEDVKSNECFCGIPLSEEHPDEPGHILTQLPCSHVFHNCCIHHHLQGSVRCPICNADVRATAPPPPSMDEVD